MVEFRTNNGKRGVDKVVRTATGYSMHVYNPGNPEAHPLDENGAELLFARGVEDDGSPFIEIEFSNMDDENSKNIISPLIESVAEEKNLKINHAKSAHGENNLCFHFDHNCLSVVFDALLLINLPNGQPLIPDIGRAFVMEQQQVRHGLEQSLLSSFGQDMYARTSPSNRDKSDGSNIPKSEINRISRLVDYFRNGIPDMNMTDNATA